jgi:hypothetical protein
LTFILKDMILVLLALIGCSSTTFAAQLTACLCDLERYFKTELAETVALFFSHCGCSTTDENLFCSIWVSSIRAVSLLIL